MKKILIDLLTSIMLGSGLLLLLSPFLFYWFLHGDYERYIWIINGPFPFSHLGGGPFQLLLSLLLLLFGAGLIIFGFRVRSSWKL